MAESINEWTVMFFIAGDNELSPLIISQVKAIKDAGYEEHTDVLVHFDSNAKGAPTRLYQVNRKRKKDPTQPKTLVGDGGDSFVRNMFEDNLDLEKEDIDEKAAPASAAIKAALQAPDKVNSKDALTNFLDFCHERYRAKHYLLYLVGHGLIVGNDTFLPDEVPVSAITLGDFEGVIRDFSDRVRKDNSAFDLLALHSCSMSAVEVAYQLKDTANYMIASEGTSYVGGWPYRQLLKKLFNTVKTADAAAIESSSYVPALVEKLYFHTLYNATDYMLSGYSLDLSLCSLAGQGFEDFKQPFEDFVAALKGALSNERGREIIQLAHLESQSYWQEDYTDLYDFCLCLRKRCDVADPIQKAVKDACDGLIDKKGEKVSPFSGLVLHSDNFGSKYQYSHGLSIYFPWSEPTDDAPVLSRRTVGQDGEPPPEEPPHGIMAKYSQYAFSKDFGDNSWFTFLRAYFAATKRKARSVEDGRDTPEEAFVMENLVPVIFNPIGALGPGGSKETGSFSKETGGYGAGCGCPSIKNYPIVPATIKGKKKIVRAPSVSESLLKRLD